MVVRHPGQADILLNLGTIMLESGRLVLKHETRDTKETGQALELVKESGKIFSSILMKLEQARDIKILGAFPRERRVDENELKQIGYLSKKRWKEASGLVVRGD